MSASLASDVEHGLEILGIAVIDADVKEAMMLRAVQTLNAAEIKAKNMTLIQWHLPIYKKSIVMIYENIVFGCR